MNTTIDKQTEECIEICNKMLRGEISAVETYDLAIEKYSSEASSSQLRRIRDEHIQSVKDLKENIRNMGGTPTDDSGAWGTFAKLVQKAANLIGEESAVEALKQGEEKGLHDYREALEEKHLFQECKTLYSVRLIPRIKSHIVTLDTLEQMVEYA